MVRRLLAACVLLIFNLLAGCGLNGGYDDCLVLLSMYDDLQVVKTAVGSDPINSYNYIEYTYANGGDKELMAEFALTYRGGPYRQSPYDVSCDGADIGYDIFLGWDERKGNDADALGGLGSELHTLYSYKVQRRPDGVGRYADATAAYVGADFILDVSKTRIIADGFGYAANPYGAVRIWSLSDGFDAGFERHLLIIGDDIPIDLRAYEDIGLTAGSDAIQIEAERRKISAREYFLNFSAPLALSDRRGGAYEDSLFNAYMGALDELLAVHYFIPRGDLFAKAESGGNNALLFSVSFEPGSTHTIRINRHASVMRK